MTALPEPARPRRGPYRTGIKRRQEILESATRVFGQHGFIGGTLRHIADEVGVSPAALMRHFATKEELLIAVLRDSDARNGEALFGDKQGLDYFDSSPRLVEHNLGHRGMVELLLTVATEATNVEHPARPHMMDRYDQHVRELVERLSEARDRGDIRDLTDVEIEREARGYIALMDGLELQWLLDPEFDLLGAWEYHYLNARHRWTDGLTPNPADPER